MCVCERECLCVCVHVCARLCVYYIQFRFCVFALDYILIGILQQGLRFLKASLQFDVSIRYMSHENYSW